MLPRPTVLPLVLVASACGAKVAGSDAGPRADAAEHADAPVHEHGEDAATRMDAARPEDAHPTHEAAGPRDAGPDCGQPAAPTYDCAMAVADAGVCHAYGADAGAGGPTYRYGCVVTTTTCDLDFGGALTCNCQNFPGNGSAPVWICPL